MKKLILASIYFDKLYIIGPTGDQYHGIERINPKADVQFIKDIKDLPSPNNGFDNVELSYNDFANICNKVWKEPYNYIVIDITKNKNINGKLRINWDRRVL